MKRKHIAGIVVAVVVFVLAGAFLAEVLNPYETVANGKNGGTVSSNDVYVLAKIISAEARGESYLGQVAVGSVVVNRVKNANFPNTVYGVVFEPGAFEAVSDGQYYNNASSTSLKAARAAINGWDPTGGALFYWNPAKPVSRWIWSRQIVTQIGRHVFAL